MEQRIIKIRIDSDNEEDLTDAFHMATECLENQPWRSDKTKVVSSWIAKK